MARLGPCLVELYQTPKPKWLLWRSSANPTEEPFRGAGAKKKLPAALLVAFHV